MESVRVIEKPRSRGLFSHQRDLWDLIHKDRFNCWLEGDPIEAIAEKHHVTPRAVHASVAKILAGLHRKYRSQALQFRHDNRSAWKAQVAGLEAYRALTDPSMLFSTNRRTVRGARATRSKKRLTRREFTINVNASAIARGDGPRSFEEMLAVQDDFLQTSPGEAQLVADLSDAQGLDPIEQSARRGTKTEAERAMQAQRLLPHRSTVTSQMQAVHERRFTLWKQGLSCPDIAELEDVEKYAVERSVNYMLSLVPDAEVLRLRNLHVAINSHKERARKYAMAMDRLLASEKTRDLDRGMTHFERSVGIAAGGVNVLVDNRQQTAVIAPGATPQSFEEIMDRVRNRLLAERNATRDSGPPAEDDPGEE